MTFFLIMTTICGAIFFLVGVVFIMKGEARDRELSRIIAVIGACLLPLSGYTLAYRAANVPVVTSYAIYETLEVSNTVLKYPVKIKIVRDVRKLEATNYTMYIIDPDNSQDIPIGIIYNPPEGLNWQPLEKLDTDE